MSLSLTHFLVGATVALIIFHDSEYRLLWMYVGGVVAMGPDLSKFLPHLLPLHDNTVASSLFLLHGFFDVVDPNDSILLAATMVAVFGITIVTLMYVEHVR